MARKIVYYTTENGKTPVKEFIEDQQPEVIKKIFFVFELIQELDHVPKKFLDKIDGSGGIYEIRIEYASNIYRVFCFFHKNSLVVLTNGYQKKSQKTDKGQIETAIKYRADYIRRG